MQDAITNGQCPYDPLSAEVLADPFPAYALLREECPVHHTSMMGREFLTVALREDVHDILTHPQRWVNRHGAGIAYSGVDGRGNLQHFDQPEHTKRRVLMRTEFNPLEVKKLAAPTQDTANALATDMPGLADANGVVELHDGYACPLPILGFIDLMGVPHEDRDRIKAWADQLVLGLTDPKAAIQPTEEIKAYINAAVSERRADADAGRTPRPGLLTEYSLRTIDGERIPLEEMEAMILQLLVAGHETTTSLITNLMWRLLEVPSRWAHVVAHPGIIPNAIEESLRFDPPVLGLFRTNEEPTTIRGIEGDVALRFGQSRPGLVLEPGRVRHRARSRRTETALRLRMGYPPLPRRATRPPDGAHRSGNSRDALPEHDSRRTDAAPRCRTPVGPPTTTGDVELIAALSAVG
jgi:cytochrome P450